MHELSIAMSIVEMAEEESERRGGLQISRRGRLEPNPLFAVFPCRSFLPHHRRQICVKCPMELDLRSTSFTLSLPRLPKPGFLRLISLMRISMSVSVPG